MKIKEVAFVGIPVTDIKRARAFYESTLGLKCTSESAGGMWVEYDIGSCTVGIGCYGDVWKPSADGTCLALEVEDLELAIGDLKARGATFAVNLTNTPVCRLAIICDPDGNRIMIHQRKSH